MSDFLETLKAWGPAGAFLVALIDGMGLPNPGGPDYLLLYLGWTRPETAYLSAVCAIAGSLPGMFFLYWLARRGGEKYLERKAGGPRAMKFRCWFEHYGLVTVFIPALVPVIPLPMKAFVLCAGALGVKPSAFLLTVAAARIPRYFGLAYLGKSLGEHSTSWLREHKWDFVLAALALILFLFLVLWLNEKYWRRRAG